MNKISTNLFPIILFTYNRLSTLKEAVSSLQENALAVQSDLIVFSDGPNLSKPRDWEKVEEVRKFLHTLQGFKSIEIREQKENKGCATSVKEGVSEIVERFGAVIVLEDDLLVSPHFLRYMNEALVRYKTQKEVFLINGFSLSPGVMKYPPGYAEDGYFLLRNHSYGWGIWADRWESCIWDREVLKSWFRERIFREDFCRAGVDLIPMLERHLRDRISSWAVVVSANIARQKKICLTSHYSYVSAIPNEEGTHIRGIEKRAFNDLSLAKENIIWPNELKPDPEILKAYARSWGELPSSFLSGQEQLSRLSGKTKKVEKEVDENTKLRIALFSTDNSGGAGRAAERLHRGLLRQKVESRLILRHRQGEVPGSYIPEGRNFNFLFSLVGRLFNNENIRKNHTMVSSGYPSLSFDELDFVKDFDLIHVHWFLGLLSYEAVAYLSHQDRPMVWTVHDKSPFMGAGHCFHGDLDVNFLETLPPEERKRAYREQIEKLDREQLTNNYRDHAAKMLDAKIKYLNSENITLVVLNEQFKNIARVSPMFQKSRIELIRNGIDTTLFSPRDRISARKNQRLPQKKKILFYLASYNSLIKGFKEFTETVHELFVLDQVGEYFLVLAGSMPDNINFPFPHKHLGYLDDARLKQVYSAADVTVLPSLEDNLPNILLESLSCGTPVAGFKVGGIPDAIEDGKTGYTVEKGDTRALAEKIKDLCSQDGEKLRKACRAYAKEYFCQEKQAASYKALYEDLLREKKRKVSWGEKNPGRPETIPEFFPETAESLTSLLIEASVLQEKENISFLERLMRSLPLPLKYLLPRSVKAMIKKLIGMR